MKGEALIYRPDATEPERREVPGGEALLPVLQELVGGFIEPVPLWKQMPDGRACWVLCNEEGKIRNLPLNVAATDAWYSAAKINVGDTLLGTVVVVFGDEEFMEAL